MGRGHTRQAGGAAAWPVPAARRPMLCSAPPHPHPGHTAPPPLRLCLPAPPRGGTPPRPLRCLRAAAAPRCPLPQSACGPPPRPATQGGRAGRCRQAGRSGVGGVSGGQLWSGAAVAAGVPALLAQLGLQPPLTGCSLGRYTIPTARAPSLASSSATERPMPLSPPVIRATCGRGGEGWHSGRWAGRCYQRPAPPSASSCRGRTLPLNLPTPR